MAKNFITSKHKHLERSQIKILGDTGYTFSEDIGGLKKFGKIFDLSVLPGGVNLVWIFFQVDNEKILLKIKNLLFVLNLAVMSVAIT